MADQMSPVDYANLPAGNPPAGVLPNFEHPQTRDMDLYVGIGLCIGITMVFIILRLYVKLCITQLWGWDDGMSPTSTCRHMMLMSIVACVTGFVRQSLVHSIGWI